MILRTKTLFTLIFLNKKLQELLVPYMKETFNDYWLNSIKHGSSCQPFYPTWITSAYMMALIASKYGYKELVDIGSGDGRIAYCSQILEITPHSIEIDRWINRITKRNF